jgi:hypothetical protein
MGAFSRHIVKGMQRIGATSDDPDLLVSAFADAQNETLVVINRAATARRLAIQGESRRWVEIEHTGLEQENAVTPFRTDNVIQAGEIVVFSTIKAE